MRARLLERVERGVERLHRRLDQRRRMRGAALEPAHRRRERRHRRLRARDRIVRLAQVARDLLDLHHGGAPLGERGLLRRLRAEPAQFLDRVAQPVGLALRALDLGAVRRRAPPRRRGARPTAAPPPRACAVEIAKGVEQPAMGGGIDQRAVVVLAVDLDQRGAERSQRLHAHRLVVDEGAGAAVGELHAPQDQFVLGRDAVVGGKRARPDGCAAARRRRSPAPARRRGAPARRRRARRAPAQRHRAGSTCRRRSRR